jgi:LysM repeat protein
VDTTPPPVFEPTNLPTIDTNLTAAVPTNLPPVMEPVPPPPPPVAQEYSIMKGDTLSSIAKKSGVSVKALQEANPGVQPTRLKVGQKLQIPASTAPAASMSASAPAVPQSGAVGEQTYKVKSGDTLTKIAKQFGTTVKAIQSANSISTTSIKVGQVLKVPAKTSAPVAPVESMPVPAPAPAPAPVPAAPPIQ